MNKIKLNVESLEVVTFKTATDGVQGYCDTNGYSCNCTGGPGCPEPSGYCHTYQGGSCGCR